jgi:molecular chaperone DnaJ
MAKSYYTLLGVTSEASQRDVKAAYRRLAKELHPDRHSGDARSFLDIQEAYSVLGDSSRRREYDDRLSQARQIEPITGQKRAGRYEPEPLIPEDQSADIGEISPIRSFQTVGPSFDEVFDWLWDNFSSLGRPKSRPVKNLTLEIPLTREQSRQGGYARVMVPARAVCPTCRGHGGVGLYECSRCAGEGAITGEVPVSMAFPAGLREDHAVVIPLDRYGTHNLYLTVLFRPTEQQQ